MNPEARALADVLRDPIGRAVIDRVFARFPAIRSAYFIGRHDISYLPTSPARMICLVFVENPLTQHEEIEAALTDALPADVGIEIRDPSFERELPAHLQPWYRARAATLHAMWSDFVRWERQLETTRNPDADVLRDLVTRFAILIISGLVFRADRSTFEHWAAFWVTILTLSRIGKVVPRRLVTQLAHPIFRPSSAATAVAIALFSAAYAAVFAPALAAWALPLYGAGCAVEFAATLLEHAALRRLVVQARVESGSAL